MMQQQYIISRKLNILELGEVLGNISQACRKLGVSRQHYYDIRQAIEEDGLEGLLEKSRRAPRIGNRVAPEIERKVLEYSQTEVLSTVVGQRHTHMSCTFTSTT